MSKQVKYIDLTPDNFVAEVTNSDIPVLVDFWAVWCGPCRVMNPIVANIAETWSGKVIVGKANVDDNEEIATNYQIQAIPTILIFDQGEVVERIPGLVDQAVLEEKLNNLTNRVSAA
ncbi:thioredoxin [Pleurocapsa sp. FMAR1]|uniref:thioredoxin n=1 Tax=Pleurocapsa sp. FMAR1 TaxID=3040204 RepID=UPI0029C8B01B|nr:thioredoxin [Pleurocapsa sp. FMAR1]